LTPDANATYKNGKRTNEYLKRKGGGGEREKENKKEGGSQPAKKLTCVRTANTVVLIKWVVCMQLHKTQTVKLKLKFMADKSISLQCTSVASYS
jgi:hypothetical protein